MKKALIVFIIIVSIFVLFGIYKLFDGQYNMKTFTSSFITVTFDETVNKKKLGNIDEYTAYVDGIDPDNSVLKTIFNGEISLTDAIKNNKMSISDIRKKAWNNRKEGISDVYIFENYEIALINSDCIIRQITNNYDVKKQ